MEVLPRRADNFADEYKRHRFYNMRPIPAHFDVDIGKKFYSDVLFSSKGFDKVAREKPSAVAEIKEGDRKACIG